MPPRIFVTNTFKDYPLHQVQQCLDPPHCSSSKKRLGQQVHVDRSPYNSLIRRQRFRHDATLENGTCIDESLWGVARVQQRTYQTTCPILHGQYKALLFEYLHSSTVPLYNLTISLRRTSNSTVLSG